MSEKPDTASTSGARTRELIVRCLDGEATEAERAALDELVARDPAVAQELARAAMLESSLEVVARAEADKVRVPNVFSARRRLFERRRSTLLLVAAALSISTISVALVVTRPWARTQSPDDASEGHHPNAAPKAHVAERGAVGEAQRTEATAPEASPSSETPPPGAAPNESRAPGAESTPSARAANVADSLKVANQLRRQGRWADAERAYSEIARGYSGSAQGSVAALAAASLRLEHLGDPRGALRLYQSARAPELSAEAELGIADCYRALGDRQGEIAALNRFLTAHPKALSRERAEGRLEALQSGKP